MSWSDPLASPITLRDGRVLRTLKDAGELLICFSEDIQAHAWVQYAAQLLVAAAKSGRPVGIEQATLQVQRALKREGML